MVSDRFPQKNIFHGFLAFKCNQNGKIGTNLKNCLVFKANNFRSIKTFRLKFWTQLPKTAFFLLAKWFVNRFYGFGVMNFQNGRPTLASTYFGSNLTPKKCFHPITLPIWGRNWYFLFCLQAFVLCISCAKYEVFWFCSSGDIGVNVLHNNMKIQDRIPGALGLGRPVAIFLSINNSKTKISTKKLFCIIEI